MPRRVCIAVLLCLVLPAQARADHPSADDLDGEVPNAVEKALGGEVTELPNGLYEVDPARGPDFTSHGPDTAADSVPSHGQSLGPGDPERPPACAAAGDDYHQHVLYAYRSGETNRIADVRDDIQASIRRMNAVLNEESLASGGVTADYRVLCDGGGEIQVDAFTTGPNATSLTNVVNAARADGFDEPNVDYTIFFDHSDPRYCGVGHFSDDESLSADNVNNRGGDYGMTYEGCWLGGTPMHENGHNQGAVQYGARFSTGDGAHCFDENDVMCYADGGDLYPGYLLSACTDRLHFDCGNDTYFDSAPADCEYLGSHWNMGSPLNRFIAFGPGTANDPPCADFTASCTQLSCGFTDSSSDPDGGVASRTWSFGDGSSSTAASPTHDYAAAGTYVVRLTVTDSAGMTETRTRVVTPQGAPPNVPPAGPGAAPPASSSPTPGSSPAEDVGDGPAKRLSNKTPLADTAAPAGRWRLFELRVPRDRSRLVIKLDCGSVCADQLDLYARRGADATLSEFDCKSSSDESDERCVIRAPRRGTWHIGVHTAAGAGGTPFEIVARYRR